MDKANFQPKAKKAKGNKKTVKGIAKVNSFMPPKSDIDVQMTIVETNGKREIVFVAAPTKRPALIDNGFPHGTGELPSSSELNICSDLEKQGSHAIEQNSMINTIPSTQMTPLTNDKDYITSISATGRGVQKIDDTYSEIISINTSDGIIESVTPVNLIKEVGTPTGIVDVATIVGMGQGSKEPDLNISSLNQVQAGTSQSSTIVSDVGFTNLLHKHLYSTTMTGTGPPLSETVLPDMEQTTTVAASSHALSIAEKVGALDPASESRLEDHNMSVNVANQDLSKLVAPLTSTGAKAGEALPQIIFVPVLTGTVPGAEGAAAAGPASASPVQQVNYMPVLAGSIPGAEPGMVVSPPIPLTNVMSPLNYGVMGAIPVPMQTPTQSVENVVYVQPNTPVVNSTSEKITEHTPVGTSTIPKVGTVITTTAPTAGTIPCPSNVRKPQRRRQSRQKSVSSDASSVDSSEATSLMKQNVVTKKIERVRRTVNTEEELNFKVSGLVSKILSQFPKEGQQLPQQQPTKPARQSPRPAKRSKSENNNNLTGMKLPHVVQSQMSASGGNILNLPVCGTLSQDLSTQGLNEDHAQLVQIKQSGLPGRQISASTGSSLENTALSQEAHGVNSAYTNQMQSNAALLNALQGKRLPKVPPKPLVSRIELPSHLTSPTAPASAANTNLISTPMIIPQDMLLKVSQPVAENSAVLAAGNVGVQVQNKNSNLVRDLCSSTVLQNPEMLITDPGLLSAATALTTLIPASMMVSGNSDVATGNPNNTLLLPQSDTFGPLEASMILSSLKSPNISGLTASSTGMVLPVPGSSGLTTLVPPALPMTLQTPVMNPSQPAIQPAIQYTQVIPDIRNL